MLPLDGLTVIDFTQAVAGPACCMLLGDFGADVVKIEAPGGETGRKWGHARFGDNDEFSSLFLAFNRNKTGEVVDLKSRAGRERAHELLAGADVVVENFAPGVADRLGIGYEEAREINPGLIYCSITGFGDEGPLRDRPGLDQLLQAYAGMASITGEEGRPPVRIGPSSIDLLSGAHAALGIMLALRVRETTGVGQRVTTSLYDNSLHMMSQFIADYTGTGKVPQKSGPLFPFSAPYGYFRALDADVFVGISRDGLFDEFCEKMDLSHLAADPRFRTNRDRILNSDSLYHEFRAALSTIAADDLLAVCEELRIPASKIYSVDDVVAQPQATERGMIVATGVGTVKAAGTPIRLSETPASLRLPPPSLTTDRLALEEVETSNG